MKNNKGKKLILMLSALLFPLISFGQFDSDILLDNCASDLGSYNYIRSFNLNAKSKKKANSECSYVFSKGSTYVLIACNNNETGGEMVINLYDKDHNLVASTFDETGGKHYPNLLYPCSATGLYYIKATFEGVKKGCGMCILGFNKD